MLQISAVLDHCAPTIPEREGRRFEGLSGLMIRGLSGPKEETETEMTLRVVSLTQECLDHPVKTEVEETMPMMMTKLCVFGPRR